MKNTISGLLAVTLTLFAPLPSVSAKSAEQIELFYNSSGWEYEFDGMTAGISSSVWLKTDDPDRGPRSSASFDCTRKEATISVLVDGLQTGTRTAGKIETLDNRPISDVRITSMSSMVMGYVPSSNVVQVLQHLYDRGGYQMRWEEDGTERLVRVRFAKNDSLWFNKEGMNLKTAAARLHNLCSIWHRGD